VEVTLPNREEAELLAGIPIESMEDCEQACRIIRGRGVKQVVVTLGETGIYCQSADGAEQIPPYPAEVVDVTGAGDAFTSGLLYGIAGGEPFSRACRLGLAAAALALETEQSVPPLLKPERLQELVNPNGKGAKAR
jgi:pseudouridine kinase